MSPLAALRAIVIAVAFAARRAGSWRDAAKSRRNHRDRRAAGQGLAVVGDFQDMAGCRRRKDGRAGGVTPEIAKRRLFLAGARSSTSAWCNMRRRDVAALYHRTR